MKVMLTITFPTAVFNAAVKDGSIGKKMNRAIEATKPEAIYFTDHDGQRCAVAFVELAKGSGIPALAEPWLLLFEAEIDLKPVMTAADLKKSGLAALGKTWG